MIILSIEKDFHWLTEHEHWLYTSRTQYHTTYYFDCVDDEGNFMREPVAPFFIEFSNEVNKDGVQTEWYEHPEWLEELLEKATDHYHEIYKLRLLFANS